MTPDQVKLVQQSFSKVAPISDQAADLFYDRLFEVAPQVKPMFPADLTEQRRQNPDYQLPVPALFGEKEGKIAKANRGRDPLYLFAALQRQLGYPEVPRPRPRPDRAARPETG